MTTREILEKAKKAKAILPLLSSEDKNRALKAMAEALIDNTAAILEANAIDV